MEMRNKSKSNSSKNISLKFVQRIISKNGKNEDTIESYDVQNASDKMLGFLCDYWKLKVNLTPSKKVLHYFLKLIPVSNEAKAKMVEEQMFFAKELHFYSVIKERIQLPGLKPWSAPFVTASKNCIVFEDLNVMQYKLRDKYERFDEDHTYEALKTMARFHASSIVYEEKKSRQMGRTYSLYEEFENHLFKGGYENSDVWFSQCREGSLKIIKASLKYTESQIKAIESRWYDIWSEGLALTDPSPEYSNVICHRDLWNNNIMFHYGDNNKPDDCLLIDFQAVRYHPPAGDVMLLLYCNLDPKYREENMQKFLNFYLSELHVILIENGIDPDVINKDKFFESAEKQRQWGLIVCACLIPQIWIDDDKITNIFMDTDQFDQNLCKDKASFIATMMKSNPDYKDKVMEVFDEIVDRYCFK